MPQSLGKVLVHIVFSTKHRHPFLNNTSIRTEMHAYLGGACKGMDCPVLIVGGVSDHVHILCSLSRTNSIAKVVGEIKSSSSRWAKTKGVHMKKFSWQSGYGIFSVDQDGVNSLRRYIAGQEEHHRMKTFQEEYRALLRKHGVEYDERYVWD